MALENLKSMDVFSVIFRKQLLIFPSLSAIQQNSNSPDNITQNPLYLSALVFSSFLSQSQRYRQLGNYKFLLS